MCDDDKMLVIADKFEVVRSGAARTIRNDLTLLRDAYVALQNNRSRVVEDHLARVIDSLYSELQRLDNATI